MGLQFWTQVRETPPAQAGPSGPYGYLFAQQQSVVCHSLASRQRCSGALFGVPGVVGGRLMARSLRLGITKTDPGWVER